MTTFLAWFAAGGSRAEEGLGVRARAPSLGMDDAAAWEFYCRNANQFVQDFGLMPVLLAREKLTGPGREIFLDKLALIHKTVLEMRMGKAQEEAEISARNAGATMFADEKT